MTSLGRKRIILSVAAMVLLLLLVRYPLYHIFSFLDINENQRNDQLPVVVTVYYEALCPDSKHFIERQLIPSFKKADMIMDVVLRPYGKARTYVNDDGSYRFDCQHGPIECQANKYHACAADLIADDFKRLEMIGCMIKDNRRPKEAFEKCAKKLHLKNTDLIQKCYNGANSSKLLKSHGDATHALRPRVTFIPTVTLDGSQGRQAAILKDLLAEVCKIIGTHPMAKVYCAEYNE